MALRVAFSKVFHVALLPVAVACLGAAGASADDLGGEEVDVPPPATAAEAPEPAAPDQPWKPAWTPVQLSIAPPVQIINSDASVYGLRVNAPYGRQQGVTGIDVGGFNRVDGALLGLQAGLINSAKGQVRGAQLGFVNWSGGDFAGFQAGVFNVIEKQAGAGQIGLANRAKDLKGVQIGLVNLTKSLKGVQIGAINYIKSRETAPFLPVLNVGW